MSNWKLFHDPNYMGKDSPYNHKIIWIWREGWEHPKLTAVADIHPMVNVIGLLWQPDSTPASITQRPEEPAHDIPPAPPL